MRGFIGFALLAIWIFSSPSVVLAQMNTLSVTVTFRERIAPPPGAELSVQLLEAAEPVSRNEPVTSQRVLVTTVPMTVALPYDPGVVEDGTWYAITAAIRGPDGLQIFRGTQMLDELKGQEPADVDLLLTMLPEADMTTTVPRRISGVAWTVTELFGQAWPNEDPATLAIDDDMNVSVFGGCNRFRGRLQPSGLGLAFPENMVGTMMACRDAVEAQERRFLAALLQVSDYVRYGSGLVMMDADGRAVLHFIETPE